MPPHVASLTHERQAHDTVLLDALKTCREDSECLPLVCRPISEGGTSYCLEPK